MSKSRKPKRSAKSPALSGTRKGLPRAATVAVLATLVVAAGGFWWSKGRKPDAQASNAPASTAVATSPAFEKLKGRWQRPDGGYVIEIKSTNPDGTLDAAYFNPQPIHVSRAQAAQEGAVLKVFVELRAANYPGSTYTLVYDAAADQLKGIYYQAAMQQQFEVFFERME
jgi:hypothetical protein